MMGQIIYNHKHFFIFILTIYINFGYAKENTTLQKMCQEFLKDIPTPQDYEFHCPPGNANMNGINEGFIVKIKNDKIEVVCAPNMMRSEFEMIYSINLMDTFKSNSTNLEMKGCPLPSKFKHFFEMTSSNNLTSLSFSNSNQSEISLGKEPFEGLTTLTYLNLESNQFRRLDVDVFYNTPNLIELKLYDNFIEFHVDHFKNLKFLKELDLADNQLTKIPNEIFKDLKSLKFLYLRQNQLTNLNSSSFFGLRDLERLTLKGNQLSNIEEDTFKNLTNFYALDLTNNKLTSLPPNLFHYNKLIDEIRICNNTNLRLPNYFFSNLTNLRKVDLSNSNLGAIPHDVFSGANNIKEIYLSGNGLNVLPNDLFKNLKKLNELHLNRNNLHTLGLPFKELNMLTILDLEDNHLKIIERNLFEDLSGLKILNLNRNKISYIDNLALKHMKNLMEIYAANNNFSFVNSPDILFGACDKLERIDFSHNKITDIDSVVNVYIKYQLKYLDLSYNHITSLNVSNMLSIHSVREINLENNDITKVNFINVKNISEKDKKLKKTTILLSNNVINCDCSNYELLCYSKRIFPSKVYDDLEIKWENLICSHPQRFSNVLFEKLELSNITCPAKQISNVPCPKDCECLARPFDKSYIANCSHKGLTTYPKIEFTPSSELNQVELHLEFNNFTSGPSSVEVKKYYSSVTRLYLSNNYIKNITSIPAKLKLLKLNNNLLERLDDEFLEHVNRSSIYLTLDGNPWICECKTKNFAQYLRSQSKTVDASRIFCANTKTAIIDLNKNSLCKEWQLITLIVVIMSVLVLSASTIAAYYRYQQEIKVWLYSKQLCLWWVTEEEADKDKMYDVFISYSHKDENFVTEHLMQKLEFFSYKICLHFRDWRVGEFITTQITDSVCQSRRTIIVLSTNFVESEWGRFEFKTAHSQAMKDERARVIVILYGDVDVENLDEELKAYLRTNTYVKWGDPYFWDKLKYALPHLKNTRNNNGSGKYGENTINAIVREGSLINSSTLLLSSAYEKTA